jgi:peptidoglycan/LPS O-acetylase OafA/YrhL
MEGKNIEVSRKHFIDNIRSVTVLLVIVYHVVYIFNSAGGPKTIGENGIPAFDGLCYFVYPWLMTIMFLLAGVSARYALQKRNEKQFLKERVQKLLIPVIGGMFLIGWLNGWVTYQYVDMFEGNNTPVFIKYLIFCLMIGPLWFNIELFVISAVLLLVKKIDKKDNLARLAEKANVFAVLLLVIPFWGSSFLLNTPLVTTFRNGIYLFVFFAGYYIFSQDKIIRMLAKFRFLLLAAGILLGILEIYYFYGKNFADDKCLTHPLTNIYAWIMMTAIIGCFRQYFNKTNKIMDYLKSRSFCWYLCHYPIMALIGYILVSIFKLPMIYTYILLLIFDFVITIAFCEIVPGFNRQVQHPAAQQKPRTGYEIANTS